MRIGDGAAFEFDPVRYATKAGGSPSTFTALSLAVLAALVLLVGCSSTTPLPDGSTPLPDPTGSIRLVVTGLPDGAAARIRVQLAEGPAWDVAGSTLLDGLAPGGYTVAIADACRGDLAPCPDLDRFVPDVAAIEVEVDADETAEVEVVYECALLQPPDAELAAALLAAIRDQSGDEDAELSCRAVGSLTQLLTRRTSSSPSITDLTGLEHARSLEVLDLTAHDGISDLSPLAGLSALRDLRLGNRNLFSSRTSLADLSPIAGLTGLEHLEVVYTHVTDITAIGGLTRLRSLAIDRNEIVDLAPLATVPFLESLSINYCETGNPTRAARSALSNLEPLTALVSLRSLSLGCHSVQDLSPLAGLVELTRLDLRVNRVADLSPLSGMRKLAWIDLQVNPVDSLEVMGAWPELTFLRADWSRVQDLRPAFLHRSRGTSLTTLNLGETCTRNLQVPSAGYVDWLRAQGVTVSITTYQFCSSFAPRPDVVSTFEVDAEGWTTAGDAGALRWIADGGPFGGPFVEADDQQTGVTWFWEAPAHFYGDAAWLLLGELRYYLRQSSTAGPFDADDVILEGAGIVLRYRHGVPIGTDWTEVVVPLSTDVAAGAWRRGSDAASQTELAAVLADLTRLRIRGEFSTTRDTGGLGHVSVSRPFP